MKIICVIPARYASKRFFGKMLANLAGKSVILRTYEAVKNMKIFDDVFVVCDDKRIFKEISSNKGKVIMSKKEHETGTDRIAEVIADIDAEIIINVQGDEPFINKKSLQLLIHEFEKDRKKEKEVITLVQKLKDQSEIENPNFVKVVLDLKGNAMYFSRSIVPFKRDSYLNFNYYEHKGVYAFRKEVLMKFSKLPMGPAEKAEKIECLRFLEHGIKISVVETLFRGIEIDTPEDLVNAQKLFE